MNFQIRKATKDDCPEIIRLIQVGKLPFKRTPFKAHAFNFIRNWQIMRKCLKVQKSMSKHWLKMVLVPNPFLNVLWHQTTKLWLVLSYFSTLIPPGKAGQSTWKTCMSHRRIGIKAQCLKITEKS